jgi:HPt (histidine-containing phosphotransfer) domain-containing protein
MSEDLFRDHPDIDTDYLNSTYGDDPETAIMMFEKYLDELPATLQLLRDSFNNQDITIFRQVIHKQKPAFSYVGLTDVSEKFHQLQTSCNQAGDLPNHKEEILQTLARIESATPVIQATLEHLRKQA